MVIKVEVVVIIILAIIAIIIIIIINSSVFQKLLSLQASNLQLLSHQIYKLIFNPVGHTRLVQTQTMDTGPAITELYCIKMNKTWYLYSWILNQ